MKTTRSFEEQVLRKRPYIERDWRAAASAAQLPVEVQADGRLRHWLSIPDTPDGIARILRVVTLDDGETRSTTRFSIGFSGKSGKLTADIDADGAVVGIDIDGASRNSI